MKIFLIISCICLTASAVPTDLGNPHKASPNLRIVGGNEAGEHEAPYYVTVFSRNPYGTEYCGGSIISRNYVLTAAHCLYQSTYNEITAGVHMFKDMTTHRMMFANNEYYIHEKYDPVNVHYDLALIKLNYKIQELNEDIQIVKLPKRSEANTSYVDKTVRIYGRGDKSDNQPSDQLTQEVRYVDVPIITNTDCQNVNPIKDAIIYSGNMCSSGNGRKGGCVGDSGGPVMYNNVQVAAVSYGDTPCLGGKPTVFTDLGKFLDWIAANSDANIEN